MLRYHRSHENQVLGFLRARPKEAGDAFRTNPRHQSDVRARISWTEGTTTREVPGRLLNICRAGAAVRTRIPTPEGTIALLRLLGDEPTPWIEGIVLASEPKARGIYRVRLKFRELCPTIFLKAAVLDSLPPIEQIPETPDDEDD